MPKTRVRKLQGTVLGIDKTGEKKKDKEGNAWEKCIFTLELRNLSKRTPKEAMPPELRRKRVKLVRWCRFDWHYRLGVRKTLEPEETEAVIRGEPTSSVYW